MLYPYYSHVNSNDRTTIHIVSTDINSYTDFEVEDLCEKVGITSYKCNDFENKEECQGESHSSECMRCSLAEFFVEVIYNKNKDITYPLSYTGNFINIKDNGYEVTFIKNFLGKIVKHGREVINTGCGFGVSVRQYGQYISKFYKYTNISVFERFNPKTGKLHGINYVKTDLCKDKFTKYIDGKIVTDIEYEKYCKSETGKLAKDLSVKTPLIEDLTFIIASYIFDSDVGYV